MSKIKPQNDPIFDPIMSVLVFVSKILLEIFKNLLRLEF